MVSATPESRPATSPTQTTLLQFKAQHVSPLLRVNNRLLGEFLRDAGDRFGTEEFVAFLAGKALPDKTIRLTTYLETRQPNDIYIEGAEAESITQLQQEGYTTIVHARAISGQRAINRQEMRSPRGRKMLTDELLKASTGSRFVAETDQPTTNAIRETHKRLSLPNTFMAFLYQLPLRENYETIGRVVTLGFYDANALFHPVPYVVEMSEEGSSFAIEYI